MKTNANSLDSFIRRTQKLARQLRTLIKRYPEDQMEPDQRIFNRLLTNDWRYPSSYEGPVEPRYSEAVKYVADLRRYHSELVEFCRYELSAPAKQVDLLMNPWLRLSGLECVRQLELQLTVLTGWNDDATDPPTRFRTAKIRRNLQTLVDDRGFKTVAAAIDVNADTLRDFLAERTAPQKKTMDRINFYLKNRRLSD